MLVNCSNVKEGCALDGWQPHILDNLLSLRGPLSGQNGLLEMCMEVSWQQSDLRCISHWVCLDDLAWRVHRAVVGVCADTSFTLVKLCEHVSPIRLILGRTESRVR